MNLHSKTLCYGLFWLTPVLFAVGTAHGDDIDAQASMNGRYGDLLQKIHCPDDAKKYGEFKEYGYRAGERWCGAAGVTGYLVWVNPDWYVWRRKAHSSSGNSRPYVPGYDVNNSRKNKSRGRDCRPVHMGIVTVNPC